MALSFQATSPFKHEISVEIPDPFLQSKSICWGGNWFDFHWSKKRQVLQRLKGGRCYHARRASMKHKESPMIGGSKDERVTRMDNVQSLCEIQTSSKIRRDSKAKCSKFLIRSHRLIPALGRAAGWMVVTQRATPAATLRSLLSTLRWRRGVPGPPSARGETKEHLQATQGHTVYRSWSEV